MEIPWQLLGTLLPLPQSNLLLKYNPAYGELWKLQERYHIFTTKQFKMKNRLTRIAPSEDSTY